MAGKSDKERATIKQMLDAVNRMIEAAKVAESARDRLIENAAIQRQLQQEEAKGSG